MCYCPTPTLHLNLALTGDSAFQLSLKKTHSVWFISVLNYGDTENVLINHLLLVIPMLYPCHYTNLWPHKPHKHAPPPPPPTHTHTHTLSKLIFFTHCPKWFFSCWHGVLVLMFHPGCISVLTVSRIILNQKHMRSHTHIQYAYTHRVHCVPGASGERWERWELLRD